MPVQGLSTMLAVLPAQMNGLIALWRARPALLSGAPERAETIAEQGIRALEDGKAVMPATPQGISRSSALKAALTAILATAQQRGGTDNERAERNFQLADSAFAALINFRQAAAAPFLSDYLLMLAEFGAALKDAEVTRKLTSLIRSLIRGFGTGNQRITSLAWLRATMISPTARLAMELGSSLSADNDRSGALEAFLHSVAMAMAGNDDALALEAVENAIALDPENTDARRVRGVLRWRAGYVGSATEDFQAAVDASPKDLEARVALAQALLKQGKPRSASNELAVVLFNNPDQTDALWLRGEAQLRRGDYASARRVDARRLWQAARADLTRALKQQPDHTNARRSRAIACYRLGELKDALEDLDELLKADPDDTEGHGWRAAVLLEQKKATEALAAVNIALTLAGSDSPPGQNRAWLLGLKGRALLDIQWPDQAIEVLQQAVGLEPKNRELAGYLLQGYKCKRDWKALTECARTLQKNTYNQDFLFCLRREEIEAFRNLGEYQAAFAALNRAPSRPRNDPDMKWLHARLLADIGDFESVLETLCADDESDSVLTLDHLSLRAWAIQNLEARDPEHRTALAKDGLDAYQAALNDSPQNAPDGVWLRKGAANAIARLGESQQAFEKYQVVITECEERVRSTVSSPRILSLLGWCHHHRGEHETALRYYKAAVDRGEQSIAVEFDYDLVHFAAASANVSTEGPKALDRYQATIQRARKENVLRRIGLLRVALHDLREFLFLARETSQSRTIAQLLCIELLEAVATVTAEFDGFCEHIYAFLEAAMSAPLPILPAEHEVLRLKIKAGRLLRKGAIVDALEFLQKAARSYSDLNQKVWAARTWRDIAFHFLSLDNANGWHQAACKALEAGLYGDDPQSGRVLLGLVTRYALLDARTTADYRSLLYNVFSEVGPDMAYLNAAKIAEDMSLGEQKLFLSTVLDLFPYKPAERWLFIGEGRNRRQIPNNDLVLEPFRPYISMRNKGFADARKAAMALE